MVYRIRKLLGNWVIYSDSKNVLHYTARILSCCYDVTSKIGPYGGFQATEPPHKPPQHLIIALLTQNLVGHHMYVDQSGHCCKFLGSFHLFEADSNVTV